MILYMSNENGNVLTHKEMLKEWEELYDGGDDTNPAGWDEHYTPIHCVTNFDKEEEPLYRKAIKQFGWNGLYITEDAYWRDGTKDNSLSALICKEDRDLSKFWDIFYGLKNTDR